MIANYLVLNNETSKGARPVERTRSPSLKRICLRGGSVQTKFSKNGSVVPHRWVWGTESFSDWPGVAEFVIVRKEVRRTKRLEWGDQI